jgi:hypothetical protein
MGTGEHVLPRCCIVVKMYGSNNGGGVMIGGFKTLGVVC